MKRTDKEIGVGIILLVATIIELAAAIVCFIYGCAGLYHHHWLAMIIGLSLSGAGVYVGLSWLAATVEHWDWFN